MRDRRVVVLSAEPPAGVRYSSSVAIKTFGEVLAHVSATRVARVVDATCFELDGAAGDDLPVRFELLELPEGCWLVVAAAAAAEAEIDPGACLRHNAALLAGGLALDGEMLWMRIALPFSMTGMMLDDALEYVTEQAAMLRPTRGVRANGPIVD
jgi:hypothetical protein